MFGGTAKTTKDKRVAVRTGTTAEMMKYCQSLSRTMTTMTLTTSMLSPKAGLPLASAGTRGAGSRALLA